MATNGGEIAIRRPRGLFDNKTTGEIVAIVICVLLGELILFLPQHGFTVSFVLRRLPYGAGFLVSWVLLLSAPSTKRDKTGRSSGLATVICLALFGLLATLAQFL